MVGINPQEDKDTFSVLLKPDYAILDNKWMKINKKNNLIAQIINTAYYYVGFRGVIPGVCPGLRSSNLLRTCGRAV